MQRQDSLSIRQDTPSPIVSLSINNRQDDSLSQNNQDGSFSSRQDSFSQSTLEDKDKEMQSCRQRSLRDDITIASVQTPERKASHAPRKRSSRSRRQDSLSRQEDTVSCRQDSLPSEPSTSSAGLSCMFLSLQTKDAVTRRETGFRRQWGRPRSYTGLSYSVQTLNQSRWVPSPLFASILHCLPRNFSLSAKRND